MEYLDEYCVIYDHRLALQRNCAYTACMARSEGPGAPASEVRLQPMLERQCARRCNGCSARWSCWQSAWNELQE